MSMAELTEQVCAQWRCFEQELPELLSEHRGRWVAYLDGVRAICDTEDEALHWAYEHLGAEQPFVIDQVTEKHPMLLSGALAFGTAQEERKT